MGISVTEFSKSVSFLIIFTTQRKQVRLVPTENTLRQGKNIQLKDLHEPPENFLLKLAVRHQTMNPFLGVAGQDPSFQNLTIQIKIV